MRRIQAIVLLLPLLLATPAFAAELPTAKPGEVGLSRERLETSGSVRSRPTGGPIPKCKWWSSR